MNRYKDLKPLELAKGSQHEYEILSVLKCLHHKVQVFSHVTGFARILHVLAQA